jgi:hypothetical protein
MAMIMCESITFKYGRVKSSELPFDDIPFAFATDDSIEKSFFNTLNIKYRTEQIDDSRSGWVCMKQFIDNNIPLLIKIDGNYINRVFKSAEFTEPKIKIRHISTLLLVGYDENNGKESVILTDNFSNGKYVPLDLNIFQKCRNTECLPYSPEYRCMYLPHDNGIRDISEYTLDKGLKTGLKNIAQKMISGSGKENLIREGFEYRNLISGIPAMKAMHNDLKAILNLRGNHNVSCKPLVLLAQFLRSNLSLGSHSAFREEFGKCLDECSNRFKMDGFKKAGVCFTELSVLWKKFIVELRKTAITSDIKDSFKRAVDYFNEIINNEEEAFNTLAAIL